MSNKKRKVVRSAELISILTKYGFQELLIQTKLKSSKELEDLEGAFVPNAKLYTRIRMVIEEMGTTFIKLGQTLSNREDLLPKALIAELKKLQDNVEPVDIDLHQKLTEDLGIIPEEYFKNIDVKPFASASISQVYRAVLKDDTKVILKVKRPGIDERVKADLLLIKDLTEILEANSKTLKKLHLKHIVLSFEKTLREELSLRNELQNIKQFERNFKGAETIHTLKAFSELSSDSILCMEYVEGIKISNVEVLQDAHLDTAEIARRGLDLYLQQVLEHGFFHADPHPGNIFVLTDGTICFIDFGSMGKMFTRDQEALEDFVMNFVAKDAKRVIRAIKQIALEVDIQNEVQLERDLLGIFELLNSESLEDIDIKVVLKQLSKVLNRNDVIMPEYVYLLMRGVILMEGIGRQLDPKMNIVENVQPYVQRILLRRLSPGYIVDKMMQTMRRTQEGLIDIPDNINEILRQLREGKLTLHFEDKKTAHANREIATALNRIAFALLIGGLYIASSVLILADKPPKLFEIPVLGMLGVLLSAFLTVIALISFFKKVK